METLLKLKNKFQRILETNSQSTHAIVDHWFCKPNWSSTNSQQVYNIYSLLSSSLQYEVQGELL